jgi:hypothetical protein
MWKETAFLDYVTGAASQLNRIPISGGSIFNSNLTRGWQQEAIDEFESGSLAATRLTQQHKRFALLN